MRRAFTLVELLALRLRSGPAVSKGFTLVELLVVIAIIVVLLALLTPAMDQAIYQAELTVCGTRTRAIAMGALDYAGANRRAYPYRKGVQDKNTAQWQPHSLNSSGGSKSVHDDRPR